MIKINADDYGLHEDINKGILEAIRNNLINSVSIACCTTSLSNQDLQAIIDLKKENPTLDIGIHPMLTEGKALTGITSLTNEKGEFPIYITGFIKNLILGKIKSADIFEELEAQIKFLLDKGMEITHIDSHQHVHLLPGVWQIYKALADKYKIKRLRSSYESLWKAILTFSPSIIIYQLIAFYRYITNPSMMKTIGIFCSCNFNTAKVQKTLEKLIKKKKDFEIMLHPGISTESLKKTYGYWRVCNWQNDLNELPKLNNLLQALQNYNKVHNQVMPYYETIPKGSQYFIRVRSWLCHFGLIESLFPKQGKILDFGCGHGYFSIYLYLSSNERIINGIDLNNEKIKLVKPLVSSLKGITLEYKDFFDMPLVEPFFYDAVSLLDVLYLIPFDIQKKILKNIYDRIKPNGALIFKETSKSFTIQYLLAYLEECLINSLRFSKSEIKFYYRSKSEWKNLLEQMGFKNIEIYRTPEEKINNYSFIYKAYK